MKTLITGSTGMIGAHFASALVSRGWPVWGVARNSAASRIATETSLYSLHRCDITDRDALARIFRLAQPDLVIHMAAQAFNGISWDCEYTTHVTNYFGTLNVLWCTREYCPSAKVLVACSSAEYGNVKPGDCPLKEDRPLRPITPYGVSKVATENLAYQYFLNYSMKIYLPRMFIHVGTGHPPATAIQNYARQLAEAACGLTKPIVRVGNMDTARDFIDVRDGVDGMIRLMESDLYGQPVNVCSGQSHRIKDILTMLIKISGLDAEVVHDPALLRPSDETLLLGSNSKLKSLGWAPRFNIHETLTAVYQDWLKRVGSSVQVAGR